MYCGSFLLYIPGLGEWKSKEARGLDEGRAGRMEVHLEEMWEGGGGWGGMLDEPDRAGPG